MMDHNQWGMEWEAASMRVRAAVLREAAALVNAAVRVNADPAATLLDTAHQLDIDANMILAGAMVKAAADNMRGGANG